MTFDKEKAWKNWPRLINIQHGSLLTKATTFSTVLLQVSYPRMSTKLEKMEKCAEQTTSSFKKKP